MCDISPNAEDTKMCISFVKWVKIECNDPQL